MRLRTLPDGRVSVYFFVNSKTAAVIAFTPVRSVGSGSGWNRLECSDGKGLPDFLAASTFAGSTAPSQNMHEGIVLSRLNRPKSSLPIIGGHFTTFSAPRVFWKAPARRSVSFGSL